MTAAVVALVPVAVWVGIVLRRLIRQRRYWDASRVDERRRAATNPPDGGGVTRGSDANWPGAAGALNGHVDGGGTLN